MKRQYAAPMAEKLEFNYRENVLATGGTEIPEVLKEGRVGPSSNSCYTHNQSEVSSVLSCAEVANPKNKKKC